MKCIFVTGSCYFQLHSNCLIQQWKSKIFVSRILFLCEVQYNDILQIYTDIPYSCYFNCGNNDINMNLGSTIIKMGYPFFIAFHCVKKSP